MSLSSILVNFIGIFCLLHYILFDTQVNAEVFTALSHIEEVLNVHTHFSKIVNLYVQAERKRLKVFKELANNFIASKLKIENEENFLQNPINLFHLIKRFSKDVSPILNVMDPTNIEDVLNDDAFSKIHMTLPDMEDLKGVALGLNRLVHTYRINISTLAGRPNPISANCNSSIIFTVEDYYEVGIQLYFKQQYTDAILWFEEAMVKSSTEGLDFEKKQELLQYLSHSYYLIKNFKMATYFNKELLQIDPNNLYAKKYSSLLNNTDENSNNNEAIDISVGNRTQVQYETLQRYEELCRNEEIYKPHPSVAKCYYYTNNSTFLILQPAKVEDIYRKPWLVIFHDIIRPHEIEVIKSLSISKLSRATVGKEQLVDYRITKSCWLHDSYYPIVKKISYFLQDITGLDVLKSAEMLQVANYGFGGYYELHFDFSRNYDDPFVGLNLGNRIATSLIYLSEVESGGNTVFPKLGISIKPIKGSAVFWYNLYKNGKGDHRTLHAACPVLHGIKWVANKWIHSFHQEFKKPCALINADITFSP